MPTSMSRSNENAPIRLALLFRDDRWRELLVITDQISWRHPLEMGINALGSTACVASSIKTMGNVGLRETMS